MKIFTVSRRHFLQLAILLNSIIITLALSFAGINEWTTIGPRGIDSRDIVVDPQNPDIVYLGTLSNGVYKSTDGGLHWEQKNDGLGCIMAECMIINPYNTDILYVGTGTKGVFKSTDAGETWMPKSTGLPVVPPAPLTVYYLAMDPEDTDRLYAARFAPYLSTNGGDSWHRLDFQNSKVNTFATDYTDPDIVYIGSDIYPLPPFPGGVWKSTDQGSTWTETNSGIDSLNGILSLAIDPHNHDHIYGGGFDYYPGGEYNSMYESTDGGATWKNINNNMNTIQTNTIVIDPTNSDILYVGHIRLGFCSGGIFKSTDGGKSWVQKNEGLDTDNILKLTIDPFRPNILYAGTWYGGVFKTIDGGESWMNLADSTMNGKQMSGCLAFDPQNPSVLFAGSLEGLYRSPDKGLTWQRLKEGLPEFFYPYDVAIDPQDTRRVYVGTGFYGFFASTDGGTTWTEGNTGLSPPDRIDAIEIHPDSSNIIYLATFEGVYRSTDYGQSWQLWADYFRDKWIRSIVFHPENSEIIYVSTFEEVCKSTDGGQSWVEKMEGLFGRDFKLIMDPNDSDILYICNYTHSRNGGVFKSVDGGESWVEKKQGIGFSGQEDRSVTSLIVDSEDPNILYCSEVSNCWDYPGVYLSTDGAETWTCINTELIDRKCIWELALDPEDHCTIYGTSDGASVVIYTREKTSVHSFASVSGPHGCALFQCYSNPFNPSVVIRYQISTLNEAPPVSLRIYNIIGQKVITLVDELEEPGYYSVHWDGRNDKGKEVASGVYIYRLLVNGGRWSETKKMVLLR